MGNDRRYQRQLRVRIKYVSAPDAGDRIARAISILLRAVVRGMSPLEKNTDAREEEPCTDASEGGVNNAD